MRTLPILPILLCCAPCSSLAVNEFDVDYNPTTGQVEAEVRAGVKARDILGAIAAQGGFELVYGDRDAAVTPGVYRGDLDDVLRRLAEPASVVFIHSDEGALRSVDVLPVGQQGRLPTPQKAAAERFFRNGAYTGPEHNREKAERWLNR